MIEHYLRERAAPGGRAVAWGSARPRWVEGAAAAEMRSGSYACRSCGRLRDGLREGPALGTVVVMAGQQKVGSDAKALVTATCVIAKMRQVMAINDKQSSPFLLHSSLILLL